MGYFCWKPWTGDSGLGLIEWVESHGYDQHWTLRAKAFFIQVAKAGYLQERCYRVAPRIVDMTTEDAQNGLVAACIYNLAFAQIDDDYYIVAPVGVSRPVYDPLIEQWYPQYFMETLTFGTGYTNFVFEVGRLLKSLTDYYVLLTSD
ncbi:hypothetical protein ED733_001121 [Metarhizium rileyi]|uniref:Uncharacterized protein n=1 Tax=Metarhizium rileyi (strain RCEF 4871) TaxID=1649241 RepID=A0A5C6G8R1_METRR|nr:hypothetical protein ED733_001121 [Metarhizium rileyi]